jgi:phosphinothricin acetyltransferase
MPASATTRPASERDLPAIAAIYRHYVEHTFITFDLDAPSLEEWQARLADARVAGYPWVVLEQDDGVAGYAITSTFRPKAAYRSTVESTIYLRPELTGQGLGRPLYETLLREAARTFHLAVAVIALPNPASASFHERIGFEPVGVLNEVGHKLGAWRDVGWWQLRL